jgi:hypothetical protein
MLVGTHGHIYPSTVAGFQKVNECLLEKKKFWSELLDLLFTCPSTSACFLLSKPLWVTQSRASRSKTTRDGKKKEEEVLIG